MVSTSSSSSSESSSTLSSSSEDERRRRKRRRKEKKKKKERRRKSRKRKEKKRRRKEEHHHNDGEGKKRSSQRESTTSDCNNNNHVNIKDGCAADGASETSPLLSPGLVVAPSPSPPNNKEPSKRSSSMMVPMTKEEYQRQYQQIRPVHDKVTGRTRMMRGTGEIVEQIVSRDAHAAINRQATRGDGAYFAKHIGMGRTSSTPK